MTADGALDQAWPASWVLALRVPLFCVVSMVLGLGGHVAAGGGVPAAGDVALIAVAVFITWRAVATSEQSLPRLVALLWATQAGIHALLPAQHCSTTGGMWAGHAVAGLLVAAWLRRGEAWAWRAAGRVLRLLRPRRGPAAMGGVRVRYAVPATVVPPVLDLWSRRLLPPRAPPCLG